MDNKSLDQIIAEAEKQLDYKKKKSSSSSEDDQKILEKDYPRIIRDDRDDR